MKALVLSGGGSKGSYQIGVWKALRRLNQRFDIVTGTSSGALNGALITQGTYHKAVNIWKKINMKILFGEDAIESKKQGEIYKLYTKNFLKNGGMDITEIEEIIKEAINKNKFYTSKINYGLVTYNLSKRKAVEIEKKDMKENQLVDYLMASATCFPAFKQKEIEGLKYIDGGYYDNLPINLAIKMGATEIIAVDLRAPGLKKGTKKKLKPDSIITIKPNNKLTNFLNFYEEGAIMNMKFGYNDTMKVFGRLEGNKFTFKKGHLAKNQKIYQATYEHVLKLVLNSKKLETSVKELLKLAPNITENVKADLFSLIMENIGIDFKINQTEIYSYKKYNKLLIKELKKQIKQQNNKVSKKAKKTEVDLYILLMKKNYKELRKQSLTHPRELLKAIYLYTICEA